MRPSAMVTGSALIALGVVMAFLARDTAVPLALVVGGLVLVLFAYLGDRLKSVGATKVELFQATRDAIAAKVDADASLTRALQENTGSGQAAAQIRAATTPEELGNVLVRLLDRPAPEHRLTTDELIEAQNELRRRGYHGTR